MLTQSESPTWGRRPIPLLPQSLRRLWASERLPDWVAWELGLSSDATFAALGADVWRTIRGDELSPFVRKFLLDVLRYRAWTLDDVRLVEHPWPRQVGPDSFPWTTRTWNGLKNAGLIDHPVRLARATPAALMRLKNMGPRSVLDFACVAEAVLSSVILPRDDGSAAQPDKPRPAASEVWAEHIHARDARFRTLLPLESGTLGEHLRRLAADRAHVAQALRRFRAARAGLRSRLDTIAAMPFADAIADLVRAVSGTSDTRAFAIVRRLGLDGEPPLSLREAGGLAGVGSERMRQIEKRFRERLPDVPLFLPQLDAAIDLLEQLAPCTPTEASRELRERGWFNGSCNVTAVLAAARLFHRPVHLVLDPSGWLRPIARSG